MTQPSFVPVAEVDQVRSALPLPVPGRWSRTRPAELRTPGQPGGHGFGRSGPDQGYALLLARRMEGRLRLAPGESAADAVVGAALLASHRAGMAGRAPTGQDVTVALTLFGFLDEASPELVAERTARFRAVAHEYPAQRRLVDSVPDDVLRVSPDQAGAAAARWRAGRTDRPGE